jgi:hypothetical protein
MSPVSVIAICVGAGFLVSLPFIAYIAKKCGPDGLRAFAEVVRAFWGRKP